MKHRKMSERQRERLQLAILADVPDWNVGALRWRKPDGCRMLSFDDAPDWYDAEINVEYRTYCSGWYFEPPDVRGGWMHVDTYTLGERECPWCGPGTGCEGDEIRERGCDACGGDGYLYLGEEYCHVYARALT